VGVELLEVVETQREFDNPGVGVVVRHNRRLVHFHQIQLPESGHHRDLAYDQELDERIDGQASYDLVCGLVCERPHHTASSLLRRCHPNFVTGADV